MSTYQIDDNNLPELIPMAYVSRQLKKTPLWVSIRLQALGKTTEVDQLDRRQRLVHREDYLELKALMESRGEL